MQGLTVLIGGMILDVQASHLHPRRLALCPEQKRPMHSET